MNTVNKIFCALLMLATCQAHGMFKAGRLLHKPTIPAAIPEQATLHLEQETKKSLDYQKKLYKAPTVHLVEAFSLFSPTLMRYIRLLDFATLSKLEHVLETLWHVNYHIKHSLEQCKTFLSNGIEFHTDFACSFVTPTYRTIAKYAHTKKQEQDRHSLIHEQSSKIMRQFMLLPRNYFPYDSISDMVVRIAQTEAKYTGYESFSHGTNGQLAILLELQKKLYALHNGRQMPTDFEFLRARQGREHLIGITREKFTTKKNICDLNDPDRTDLLSVGYHPLGIPLYFCFYNRTDDQISLKGLIEKTLAVYGLPMPSDLNFPKISHGLLLHILIKKETADRLVYNSKPRGVPADNIRLPDYTDPQRMSGQARIILDPTSFGQPNDDVKMYCHEQFTDQEKKAIDTFCDELIEKAQKLKELKERKELEKTRS